MKNKLKALGLFLVLKLAEILFAIGAVVSVLVGVCLFILLVTKISPYIMWWIIVTFLGFMGTGVLLALIENNCQKVSRIMHGRSTLLEEIRDIAP